LIKPGKASVHNRFARCVTSGRHLYPKTSPNLPVTAGNGTLEKTHFLFGLLLRVYQVIHYQGWPLSTM
jgi:hypothetical protein